MYYHERQKWSLCGVHRVCEELDSNNHKYWNAHRSALGIGNYDVNVLMFVCEQEGLLVDWHDARTEVTETLLEETIASLLSSSPSPLMAKAPDSSNLNLSDDDNDKILGIIINLPSKGIWSKLTQGRHWLTLLWSFANKQWINLDSELKQPDIIGNSAACAKQLQQWREDAKGDCHILFVSKK